MANILVPLSRSAVSRFVMSRSGVSRFVMSRSGVSRFVVCRFAVCRFVVCHSAVFANPLVSAGLQPAAAKYKDL